MGTIAKYMQNNTLPLKSENTRGHICDEAYIDVVTLSYQMSATMIWTM